jgi:hypothetical protein
MFCPNCGANNSTEQKFCRSCGLNLEKSAESLVEQMPSAQSANLLKQERILEKFGDFAWGGFGLVILIAVGASIYGIVTKMILTGNNVFVGVLLALFVIFGFLSLAYVVINEILKEEKQKTKSVMKNELGDTGDTAKRLEEKPFEPLPSITENSTELLLTKNKTSKLR